MIKPRYLMRSARATSCCAEKQMIAACKQCSSVHSEHILCLMYHDDLLSMTGSA